MYFVEVTLGKMENLKKKKQMMVKHLNFHLHNTLCLPEGLHKI